MQMANVRHIQYEELQSEEDWQYFVGDVFESADLQYEAFSMVENEPLYDPQIHLKFTEPDFVVLLNNNFQQVKYISTDRNDKYPLAYTAPFRILSDEGYSVLKAIIKREFVNCQGDLRQPNYIQSIGYRSQWIKDFNRCPVVRDYLSKLCGEPLMVTTLKSTYSHTNIGLVDPDKGVDQWHTDSVPFVIIILTCDMTNTVGGELQLIEREKQEASKLISQYNGNVPDEYVKNIEFDGPGSVIFMQGCAVQHRVKPVMAGTEPRITVVNSYMSRNPFAIEKTRYDTFRMEPTTNYEFTLHKSWRAREQLKALLMYNKKWPTKDELIKRLNLVIKELVDCRDLLDGTATDALGYYSTDSKQMRMYDGDYRVEKKVLNLNET